ncbi:hypothetical protein [Cellulomonas sp. URHE0023]|uniref:hypothetical protein n=1 Tax=Cellulomonas sp. URHE0023 TaxID=1380354 RepID=UPI00068AB60C|nr:hypothetical protein [Cellulomonas sp. URHE0023]
MRLRISHAAVVTVLGAAYTGLVVNALLVVACLPFLVVLAATDAARSWPLLAVLAPTTFPAFVATARVFADETDGVVRTFTGTWRSLWRRSATLGAIASAVVTVLAVDIRALFGREQGAVLIPVLAVLLALAVVVTVHAVVVLSQVPDARLRDVIVWSALLGVRHWYLSLASLLVLAVQLTFLNAEPVLALGLTTAPLLYVVWANTSFALRRAIVPVAAAQPVG